MSFLNLAHHVDIKLFCVACDEQMVHVIGESHVFACEKCGWKVRFRVREWPDNLKEW